MKPLAALGFLCLLIAAGVFFGCEPKSAWVGNYEAQPGHGHTGAVTLSLQADGKGSWTAAPEIIPLRWEERKGTLWLHLRSGGVLVGRPITAGKAVAVDMPGREPVVFTKTQN